MPKENKIRVLYVQPGKYPEERIIENNLKSMQKLVDGDIEGVYPWRDYACIVCNDEGKLNNMPLNRLLEDYDILAEPLPPRWKCVCTASFTTPSTMSPTL